MGILYNFKVCIYVYIFVWGISVQDKA